MSSAQDTNDKRVVFQAPAGMVDRLHAFGRFYGRQPYAEWRLAGAALVHQHSLAMLN
jgi:hypothetical protein